ncbi:MAG: hypothetical protein H8E46_07610 [FCB group bacterium]|nr:hypothetical protein [FCB group bacterium]
MTGIYGRIGKLLIGLAIMSLVFGFLGFGRLPGSVLNRNLNAGIDASPLFYTEVENFWEIEHR